MHNFVSNVEVGIYDINYIEKEHFYQSEKNKRNIDSAVQLFLGQSITHLVCQTKYDSYTLHCIDYSCLSVVQQ